MDAAPLVLDAVSPAVAAGTAPFASMYVTLIKQEHIELVLMANRWKSLHARAVSRPGQVEVSYKRLVLQLQEHAKQREAKYAAELEWAQARVRDFQQRLFGRKSERSKGGTELQSRPLPPRLPRGQQRGAPGHGRKMLAHLSERREIAALDLPLCPACGEPLGDFPGTEDSAVGWSGNANACAQQIHDDGWRTTIDTFRARRAEPVACAAESDELVMAADATALAHGRCHFSMAFAMLSTVRWMQPSANVGVLHAALPAR